MHLKYGPPLGLLAHFCAAHVAVVFLEFLGLVVGAAEPLFAIAGPIGAIRARDHRRGSGQALVVASCPKSIFRRAID